MKAVLTGGRVATLILISAPVFLLGCARSVPAPEPKKLSVLFILVDDLNTRLGTYGDPVVQTSSIDHLASVGVRFDRAYSQYPMCNASRSSLLSGLYPEFTGVLTNDMEFRKVVGDMALLPEYFRFHGYHTHGVGKIEHHPGTISWGKPIAGDPVPPVAAAHRVRSHASTGEASLDEDERLDADPVQGTDSPSPLSQQASHPSGSLIRGQGSKDDKALGDETTTTNAIRWLEKNPDKPFFLAVGFDSTHLPFIAPLRHLRRYPPYTIQLRREPPGHLAKVPLIALTQHPGDAVTDWEHRAIIGQYLACVTYIDEQVGRLLAALERLDLRQRTVVVLTSDHGFLLGEHENHWRKGSLFDESARVPLIIAGPGISAGIPSGQPANLVDLYPTLVELAGLPRPEGLQGRSLVNQLRDPKTPRKRPAYTIVRRNRGELLGRSIQTGRYRYTEWGGKDLAELYDLWVDPFEYRNLVPGDRRQQRIAKRLSRELQKTVKRSTSLRDRQEPSPDEI